MAFIDDFLNNKYITTRIENDNLDLTIISSLNCKGSLDDFVHSFINAESFPYTNYLYNELVACSKDRLSRDDLIALNGIVKRYTQLVDINLEKIFNKMSDDDISKEYGFTKEEISIMGRTSIYNHIKGGHFCEMLLMNIMMELKYEKVLSKLYWCLFHSSDSPTPTGIDVPFYKKEKKSLFLGECKLYKDIKAAIASVVKDIEEILNNYKFNEELLNWQIKIREIPENVKEDIKDLGAFIDKDAFINNLKEIYCVGFVVANKIDEALLLKYLGTLKINNKYSGKIKVFIVVVPIDSKDDFVVSCEKAIDELGEEYGY